MSHSDKNTDQNAVIENCWSQLQCFTDARIALGRVGSALPTQELLRFQWDHACARDAVHQPLNSELLCTQLEQATGCDCINLHSQAKNRSAYLQRPDLGRQLDELSVTTLIHQRQQVEAANDLAIVIADGLSSAAIQDNVVALTHHLVAALQAESFKLAPISVIRQGRVASGDAVAELLGCKMLVIIIGERPGLSSPDSIGIYYTYAPKTGTLDAGRNCISNIRPAGLSIATATEKLLWIIHESRRLGLSGVRLKEALPDPSALNQQSKNFLLSAV